MTRCRPVGRLSVVGLAGVLAVAPALARAHTPAPGKESQQRGGTAEQEPAAEAKPSDVDESEPGPSDSTEPATDADVPEQPPGSDKTAETTEDKAEPETAETPAAEAADDGAAPPAAGPTSAPTPDRTTTRARATGPRRGSGRLFDRSDDRLLFTAGAVSLGVGIAATIPMTVGLVLGADADERLALQDEPADPDNPTSGGLSSEADSDRKRIMDFGETMNKMAIGSAVVAGVYIAGGLVMIGLALRARKKDERRTALAPWGGRHGAGLMLRGRF